MANPLQFRNYELPGGQDVRAVRQDAWYVCAVPRKRLKQLMRRSDWPALKDYALWLTLLAVSGAAVWLTWGSWWVVPALVVYGVLYASAAESRFHELLHGTPFKSRALNEFFLHVLGFMALKNSVLWRWSHARHHTETIVVGRDPEIAYPRPPDVMGMALNILHLRAGPKELGKMARHVAGRLSAAERDFVPADQTTEVFRVARLQALAMVLLVAWSVAAGSWLPLMFIGLPTFYGSWLHHLLSATQHAGLAEDVADHRLNTRTIILNPVLRFIYSNMNYHIEHHMFPLVPFHALPALHEEIKDDCPPAYQGLRAALGEMVPTLKQQLTDPGHFVHVSLPGAGRAVPA